MQLHLRLGPDPDLIAIETTNSGSDQPLEFDVADELSEKELELRIRTVAPVPFAIPGLAIDKVSTPNVPGSLPNVLGLKDWLPFLRLGPAGRRAGQDVLARQGESGYVVFGPYWPLAAGNMWRSLLSILTSRKKHRHRPTRLFPDRTYRLSKARQSLPTVVQMSCSTGDKLRSLTHSRSTHPSAVLTW